MLNHIGQNDVAERIHNAWLYTIENGIHTQDIFKKGVSKELVGTQAFAQAVVKNLGKKPAKLQPVSYASAKDMGSMKGWVVQFSSSDFLISSSLLFQLTLLLRKKWLESMFLYTGLLRMVLQKTSLR